MSAAAAAMKPVAMMEEGHLAKPLKPAGEGGRWSVLRGNLTPWWFLGSAYTLVFLARLGVPRIWNDTPTMAFHIPMAFLFVLGCAWNLFHTPHQGPRFRLAHVWVGWITMVVGVASVASGYAYILDGTSKLPLGTKVLMMSIGMIQLGLQALGLWYVRGRRWIQMHMSMMTYLFYTSGVLIAINWIPKMATGHPLEGSGQTNWTFVSMVAGLGLSNIAVKYNRRNMDLSL